MNATQMTKPLSPSALAIEDAYFNAAGFGYRNTLAATLRAAADQVVPPSEEYWPAEVTIRRKLLAIAAELENY